MDPWHWSGNASRRRMSLHQAGTVGVDPKHQERKPDRLKGIALTRNCKSREICQRIVGIDIFKPFTWLPTWTNYVRLFSKLRNKIHQNNVSIFSDDSSLRSIPVMIFVDKQLHWLHAGVHLMLTHWFTILANGVSLIKSFLKRMLICRSFKIQIIRWHSHNLQSWPTCCCFIRNNFIHVSSSSTHHQQHPLHHIPIPQTSTNHVSNPSNLSPVYPSSVDVCWGLWHLPPCHPTPANDTYNKPSERGRNIFL